LVVGFGCDFGFGFGPDTRVTAAAGVIVTGDGSLVVLVEEPQPLSAIAATTPASTPGRTLPTVSRRPGSGAGAGAGAVGSPK
jgi:hypothetical protein